LTIIQGDISTVEADAVVNPTNASFYLGGEVGMYFAYYSSLFLFELFVMRKSHTFSLWKISLEITLG